MRASLVAVILLALAAPLPACAHLPPPRRAAAMAGWEHRHPIAAQELGNWVQTHQPAARQLFEWDAHHPRGARQLVGWALTHPRQPVDRFVASHLGRPGFIRMLEAHRPASQTFLAWCRRQPQAAEDLVAHPGGLAWAGNHLFASTRLMEHH